MAGGKAWQAAGRCRAQATSATRDVVLSQLPRCSATTCCEGRPGFRFSDAIWRRLVWWLAPAAPLASVFSVLADGLQEPSGHGVDMDVTRESVSGVVLTEQPQAYQASPEQRSAMGWRAGWGHERQRKSPRWRQGLGRAMSQTTQPSSGAGGLDAAAQLAAKAKGSASTQDGKRAWNITEFIFHTVNRIE